MGWHAALVTLVAGTLLLGSGVREARAEVSGGIRLRCDMVARGIDGDVADETTPEDVDFACQQQIPATGPLSVAGIVASYGGADGVLTPSDMRILEASADNILEESCTEAVLNCAMMLLTFFNDEGRIRIDVPTGLSSIENGSMDFDCDSEGPGILQDNDCVRLAGNINGDGLFVVRVMNVSGLHGQYFTTNVEQESVEISYAVPIGLPAGPGDYDLDGVPTVTDNCPQWPNGGQQNTDSAALTLAGAPNDATVPTGDRDGDACDLDDDNDWLEDQYEPAFPMPVSPPGPCVPATAPTLVLNADTDGDRVRDGAECVMGYDPTSALSKPPGIPVGDTDRDGLSDDHEAVIGSDPAVLDTDSDGIIDGIEVRGYQSSPTLDDTDRDGCSDDTEIASVNADYVVNSLDLLAVATRFNNRTVAMIDVNKDGVINSLDLVLVAKSFDTTPCG